MLKKGLLSFVIITSLTSAGCLGFLEKNEPFQPKFSGQIHQGTDFQFFLASDWQPIALSSLQVPKETIAVFRPIAEDNQTSVSINITKISISQKTSSLEFLKQKKIQHEKTIENFSLQKDEKIDLINQSKKDNTLLLTFSGKASTYGNNLKFVQTGLVQNNQAFLITATMREKTDETTSSMIQDMLKSFHLVTKTE